MSKPIRVLHVIGSMNMGGAETLIMNLYRAIDKSVIQFDFMVSTDKSAVYDDEINSLGGRIFRIPGFKGINVLTYAKVVNKVFKEHPEIKIVHGHIGSSAAVYLSIAKKYGCKTIAHSHNTNSHNLIYNFFAYPARHIADKLFACSNQAGIDRYGKKQWKKKKGIVIKNGINISKFKFDHNTRNKYRHELGFDDKVVIGHVGRFNQQKNHVFLIDVFYELQKKEKNVLLWLIGIGDLQRTIKEKVTELGILDKVVFAGLRDDVDKCLMAMDVFLFPSIFEGLGIAIIEAQTTGLPCVVSEAIVAEADLHAGLLSRLNFGDSVDKWVDAVLEKQSIKRKDTSEYAVKSGYDINWIAKQLTELYLTL